jgi:hypothetical protein
VQLDLNSLYEAYTFGLVDRTCEVETLLQVGCLCFGMPFFFAFDWV